MALVKIPLEQRFWSKVLKTDTCWLWQSQLNNRGYGVFMYWSKKLKLPSRQMYAHRVSWKLTNGEIPDGINVLHKCDNPRCCRPDHLFLGTQKDNIQDMVTKGRVCRTTPSWRSHLTEDDVRAIRTDPRKHHIIAADYGLKERTTVWMIKHRRTWTWVE